MIYMYLVCPPHVCSLEENVTTSFVAYGVYDTSFKYKENPLIGMCGFNPSIDLTDNFWASKVSSNLFDNLSVGLLSILWSFVNYPNLHAVLYYRCM